MHLLDQLEALFTGRFSLREDPDKVRHAIFFDFDRTLTVVHVFKSLAGWIDQEVGMLGGLGAVPAPHAMTERGQLKRLCELGPAWIEQAFGGHSRVDGLRSLLGLLVAKPGCKVVLLTRGYVGTARKCLADLDLLRYFHKVYGNVGAAYDMVSKYDAQAEREEGLDMEMEELLGSAENASWETKADVIFECMHLWNLQQKDVQFIDDDATEIGVVSHAVRTVHVASPAGITVAEVAKIFEFAGLTQKEAATQSLQCWNVLPDPLTCRPPPIVTFNRAHLPVMMQRHLFSLEEELKACLYPMKRIKLLLRNPMLMLAVAQREFVRHQLEGHKFTLKGMKKMVQTMQAQVGLHDDVQVEDVSVIPSFEATDPSRTLTTGDTFAPQLSGSTEGTDGGEEQPQPAQGSVRRGTKLYAQVKSPTSGVARGPGFHANVLYNTVASLQENLLGLTPIHMSFPLPGALPGMRGQALIGVHNTDSSDSAAVWSRYEKLESLGAGHFGEVWRARELCSGKMVAIKVLERMEHGSGDDEEAGGLEISVLKSLTHPNLLRMHEGVLTKDELFIVSELADGGNLLAFGKAKASGSQDWIAGSLAQIVSAVAHCHRNNVLHGDIKPENVLVGGTRPDKSPFCIVCDFGHAAICIGTRIPIAAPGDPRYIAPEVMAEEFVSPKSDIYMLGVTGFELLSGGWLPYFNSKSVTLHNSYYQLKLGGARERILSKEGLGLEEMQYLKHVPPEAQELMKCMLDKEESLRPTAKEVLESVWLQNASRPCKTAYDTKVSGKKGWGLWWPGKVGFAEGLKQRTSTSKSYRLLLTLISHFLDPAYMLPMRLLFRRMDEDGTGIITHAKFKRFCDHQTCHALDSALVDSLFDAADLTGQQRLTFRNVRMLFFDLESFSDDELLVEARSMLNRLRGPVSDVNTETKSSFSSFNPALVCGNNCLCEPRVNPHEFDDAMANPCIKKLLVEILPCCAAGAKEVEAVDIIRILRESLI